MSKEKHNPFKEWASETNAFDNDPVAELEAFFQEHAPQLWSTVSAIIEEEEMSGQSMAGDPRAKEVLDQMDGLIEKQRRRNAWLRIQRAVEDITFFVIPIALGLITPIAILKLQKIIASRV